MTMDTRVEETTAFIAVNGKIMGVDIVDLCREIENFKTSFVESVVVDLSKVSFIDSHGLGGLVYSHILLEKNKKKLVLSAPSGHTKDLFRDCALEKVLHITDSMETHSADAS